MKIILGITLILLFFLNNFIIVSSQSINTVITQNAGIISITFSGVDFTQNTLGNVFIVGKTSNSGSNSGSKSDCIFISTNNDYFDLTPLRKSGSSYYNSTDSIGFKYYFNLCGTLSSTLTNTVNPPAINIQSLQYAGGDVFITGRSFRNTFTINNINSITLFYDSEIVLGTCQRKVYYNLICDPNVDISIGTVQESWDLCVYTTTISSKYACSTKIPGFPLVFQTPTNNIITFNYSLNEFPSSIIIPNYNLFLPLDKSCPSGCNKHGSCNGALECVCDEGYASYDCSVKIDKKHLGLPTLDKSTILFEGAKDNSFEVLLSHVGEFNDLQYPESVYYIPWVEGLSYKQSTTQYTLGFNTSYIFSNTQNIINQYFVQGIIEGNINDDPTSRNFYGSELQLMKTSFTIVIDTNSLIAIQNNHMEIIFQITAKGKNELKIQSHDQHILFSKGSSYLMMSVSGRSVDLNGKILPTYITPKIFEMNSNIINYDSDSTYIGLQFPSNGSKIALTFSSFVKKEDEKWKIIVGVVVPVVVVASLVGTFIYIYKFKKNPKVVNMVDKLKTISSSSSSLNTTPTKTETQTNSTIELQTIEPVNQE
ncbi:hypothetical protein DLAC_01753 [Tieghemostelium lacteum]|uniref:MRH domain-containing protein n=1 Tax=Tieghemostelium lacteum TaxID=361077 RepID=A0A152A683_TIELA|nr:hypothetical protein DLAC_01753 [Tieghemostelium lacteum]|eukprot:KYR01744.1 hypothetical protein DLAC_01753 [Tieghemostelium lacteum]